jgi:hypothetical protein
VSEFTGVCQCANKTVSLKGSPPGFAKQARPAVPKLCQNPIQLRCRGLLRARSRFPEIVENIRNAGQRMELLERGFVLAKQVLSQLSYTPNEPFHFRAFSHSVHAIFVDLLQRSHLCQNPAACFSLIQMGAQ